MNHLRRAVQAVLFASATVLAVLTVLPPQIEAQSNQCTVCHKRRDTLVLTCGSPEYIRHKDHGDTDGPCSVSQ